jgi:O-acetylserine/cysteine efflux transporter
MEAIAREAPRLGEAGRRVVRPRHVGLMLAVVALWGLNFTAIKVALTDIPPLMLCALRFFLASIPGVFFVKRPALPYRDIVSYGLVFFALQYGLLFCGMHFGVTAGLASLMMQTHVFFTMVLARAILDERPSRLQVAGALVSFSGIGYLACHLGGDVTGLGLTLIVAGAAAWGIGNVMARRQGDVDAIALVVWSALFAWPPLVVLSFVLERPHFILRAGHSLSSSTTLAVLYIAYPVTVGTFAAWSKLLHLYRAAIVAPFTLLVPIVGVTISAILLQEQVQAWKVAAGGLVIAGLCLNVFSARLAQGLQRCYQGTP